MCQDSPDIKRSRPRVRPDKKKSQVKEVIVLAKIILTCILGVPKYKEEDT